MNRVVPTHGPPPSTSTSKSCRSPETSVEASGPIFTSRLSPRLPKNFHSPTGSNASGGSNRFCCYCSSPSTSFDAFCPMNCIPSETSSSLSTSSSISNTFESTSSSGSKSKIFPSTRFFIAILLCFCFISLSISTSNLSVSMVCMIRKPASVVATVRREYPNDSRGIPKSRPHEAKELSYPFNILQRQQNSSDRPPQSGPINTSEQRQLNAEIMRLKRSLTANTTKWEVGNTSDDVLSESDTLTANSTAQFVNSSGIIAEILQVLDRIGLDNATLQYRAKDSVEFQRTPSNSFVPAVPLKMCQLARFRKHAHSYSEFWTDGIDEDEVYNSGEKSFGELKTEIASEEMSANGHLTVTIESCYESGKLDWSSTDQGIVFAAQNAGSLLMLFTGAQADRLNSKWTIVAALLLLVISNAVLPIFAASSVWMVVAARVLTGFSDALLQPSTSSMITRWFPPKERPFAVGLITGGRQIGTLMILPVAGFLCSRQDIIQGWPAIFYLSALIGSVILVVWLFMAADKPSKHFCTSHAERFFVEQKISEENLGKRTQRRTVPWREIAHCRPFYIGVAALICHEYPLVIMLQLLPKYINDVLKFSITTNGIVSALPIAVLFISKTLSSSLSSLIGARKKGRFVIARTSLVKIFNAVASLGLGVCVAIVPLLTSENQKVMAIIVLCFANAFAGLHTPGVQTALLQLAPAYTGIITGIAFGFVAIFGIINKVLSNYIVQSGTINEWTIVFWIAAVVAILPVGFFSLWGSADRQPWATNNIGTSTSCPTLTTNKIMPINFMNRVYTIPPDINKPKTIA